MPINDSIFWTDSTCVLGYIGNNGKRFHTFAANRVAAILHASSPSQWRHISGKQNPADNVSRGLTAEALLKSERWITGPSFLWNPEVTWSWPEMAAPAIADNDPEVKNGSQVFSTSAADDGGVTFNQIFEHFLQWHRLKKFATWMLRYCANLRAAVKQRKAGNSVPLKSTKKTKVKPNHRRGDEFRRKGNPATGPEGKLSGRDCWPEDFYVHHRTAPLPEISKTFQV